MSRPAENPQEPPLKSTLAVSLAATDVSRRKNTWSFREAMDAGFLPD